jgi:hypothetical protein
MHLTPTNGSLVNQSESWFAKITDQRILSPVPPVLKTLLSKLDSSHFAGVIRFE